MSGAQKNIATSAGLGLAAGLLLSIAVTAGNFALPSFALPLAIFGFPAAAGCVIAVAKRLAARLPVAPSLAKFLIVGSVSTLLELAVLNLLFAATGITAGAGFSAFKAFTYLLGMANSFVFNKYWSFDAHGTNVALEAGKFAAVNVLGLVLNVGTASFIVNVMGAPPGVSGALWANFAALVAVGIVLIWNFLNYKFFVFRREARSSSAA